MATVLCETCSGKGLIALGNICAICHGRGTLPRLEIRLKVIGADWRIPLDEAWQRIGSDRAIQGNLDPTLLLGPLDRTFAATDDVIARARGRYGHIFNLGHGILPTTPVEHVQALARYVHQKTRT